MDVCIDSIFLLHLQPSSSGCVLRLSIVYLDWCDTYIIGSYAGKIFDRGYLLHTQVFILAYYAPHDLNFLQLALNLGTPLQRMGTYLRFMDLSSTLNPTLPIWKLGGHVAVWFLPGWIFR